MPQSHSHQQLTADDCPDANGAITIRLADVDCPHGNTEAQPVATVYDAKYADLFAAAPDMLEALKQCVVIMNHTGGMRDTVERAEAEIAKATS